MSYYYSASSNYPSPTRKVQKQRSTYSLQPSTSWLLSDTEVGQYSQRNLPGIPSAKVPSASPKSRLVDLINMFESINAVSTLKTAVPAIEGGINDLNLSPRNAVDETTTKPPLRKLSTIVFSPRPPSTGRYESVFFEDESPIEKDDVFTCPPQKSVGSVRITKLERAKRTPYPPKTSSNQVEELTQSSNMLNITDAAAIIPAKGENINSFRKNSIKDRIRFYDGGSDLPTSNCTFRFLIKTGMVY